jgi:hypothetical protein
MVRVLTICVTFFGAGVFWRWVPPDQFSKLVQPLIVALSIMAAGLLVRLNRGMPTLDWKSLDPNERKMLTQRVVELTREYSLMLLLQALALIDLLVLVVASPDQLSTNGQHAAFAVTGALLGLCLARMAYVVWRDLDIVNLQKKLIDDAADQETLKKAQEDARSNVAAIRASGLRPGPKPEASAWSEK